MNENFKNLPPQELYEKQTGKTPWQNHPRNLKMYYTKEYLEWFGNWMNTSNSVGLKFFNDYTKSLKNK